MTRPKVAILLESDFYEHEIWYYHYRFQEDGIDAQFVTRLWGQDAITFKGHEYHAPFECRGDLEALDDAALDALDALIVPSGMVSDRLRYTEDLSKLPPATQLLQRAFARPNLIKGIICHGLWLCAPDTTMIRGRRLTCHPNLHGDALAYGANFVDDDLVVDGDLVTARTGNQAHLLARQIIDTIAERQASVEIPGRVAAC
jgi:protease I